MSFGLEQNNGLLVCFGFMSQDGDITVGMETMKDVSAGRDAGTQTLGANGDATVGADFQRRAHTPDVRPPGATRCWTQDRAIFAAGFMSGRIGSAAQFAMDLLGVAMPAQFGQKCVGGFRGSDVFGSEQSGQPTLPVLVLTFDFAFGLGSAGVTQGNAIEVQGGSELSQRLGTLWEEKAMAVHVEFKRQTMFSEGSGKKVQVGQQVFGMINLGAGADAGAVIQQVKQRIISFVAREPTVRGGVELPERADFEALPAADRSGLAS